jgi:hypothetical protein
LNFFCDNISCLLFWNIKLKDKEVTNNLNIKYNKNSKKEKWFNILSLFWYLCSKLEELVG